MWSLKVGLNSKAVVESVRPKPAKLPSTVGASAAGAGGPLTEWEFLEYPLFPSTGAPASSRTGSHTSPDELQLDAADEDPRQELKNKPSGGLAGVSLVCAPYRMQKCLGLETCDAGLRLMMTLQMLAQHDKFLSS